MATENQKRIDNLHHFLQGYSFFLCSSEEMFKRRKKISEILHCGEEQIVFDPKEVVEDTVVLINRHVDTSALSKTPPIMIGNLVCNADTFNQIALPDYQYGSLVIPHLTSLEGETFVVPQWVVRLCFDSLKVGTQGVVKLPETLRELDIPHLCGLEGEENAGVSFDMFSMQGKTFKVRTKEGRERRNMEV